MILYQQFQNTDFVINYLIIRRLILHQCAFRTVIIWRGESFVARLLCVKGGEWKCKVSVSASRWLLHRSQYGIQSHWLEVRLSVIT